MAVLSASEVALSAVFDAFPEAVLLTDADDRLVYANWAAADLLGFTQRERMEGKSLAELFCGSWSCVDVVARAADGREVPVRVSHGPSLALGPGHQLFILRPRAARRVPQLSAEVLASRVGHELANLLTPLLGYLELNRLAGTPNDDLEGMLETFLHLSRRMLAHVQNLLALRERPEPVLRPVPLAHILSRGVTWAMETGLLASHQLNVPALDRDIVVLAEGELLQQLLVNLLVNAAESMRRPGRIDVEIHCSGERTDLLVKDQGGGVPAELAERIYEPLFSTKSNGRAVGLGLFVARRIAERHRGRLGHFPNRPAGTVFSLQLPMPA